jgi:hypothetical protein
MKLNHCTYPSPNQFVAQNKYASISLQEFKDLFIIEFTITDLIFQDHVTAIHIHSNQNGQPGPILLWLITSHQWQSGVTQLTPGKNQPCCTKIAGSQCNLTAPNGTVFVDSAQSNVVYKKIVPKNICGNSCPGITLQAPFGFLVVHGNNFQTVQIDGCLSAGQPGLDVLVATPLTKKNNDVLTHMTPSPFLKK